MMWPPGIGAVEPRGVVRLDLLPIFVGGGKRCVG